MRSVLRAVRTARAVKKAVWVLTFKAILIIVHGGTCYGQSVQEVIAHHVEAIGGEAHWKALRFLQLETKEAVEGKFNLHSHTFITHQVGARIEETYGKVKTTYIINQQGGWGSLPRDHGYVPMGEARYKGMRTMLDLQPAFIDYIKKGHSFVLKKRKKRVNKRKCYVIQGMLKGGREVTYYIDAENYKLLKEEVKYGRTANWTITYEDYKEVKGYLFSFKQEVKGTGFRTERITVSIVVNERLEAALFDIEK